MKDEAAQAVLLKPHWRATEAARCATEVLLALWLQGKRSSSLVGLL